MSPMTFAFLISLFAGLSTAVGGLIPLFAKKTNTAFLCFSLGLSAGVMVYISFMELLPEAIGSLSAVYGQRTGYLMSLGFFLLGMAVIALIDKLVPEDENPGLENLEGLKEDDRQRLETLKARLLPTEYDDTMPIRNLSLLTERCNKGIGNRFFFDKKQRLRAYQNEGQFIPRLTLNVFSKWYSKTDTFPLFWSENDGADYIDAIDNCFTKIVRKILD